MEIDRSLISFSFYSAFGSNRPIKTMNLKLSFRHVPIDLFVKFETYKNLFLLNLYIRSFSLFHLFATFCFPFPFPFLSAPHRKIDFPECVGSSQWKPVCLSEILFSNIVNYVFSIWCAFPLLSDVFACTSDRLLYARLTYFAIHDLHHHEYSRVSVSASEEYFLTFRMETISKSPSVSSMFDGVD